MISTTERIHGHYRRFIALDELKAHLDQVGFDPIWVDEADNVAAISEDNLVVISIAAVHH